RKLSISVVLPEPISPVITTKPSVNQIVDSMYALARACCLDRYRNCGSGLSRNGSSFSLNGSRYMRSRAGCMRRYSARLLAVGVRHPAKRAGGREFQATVLILGDAPSGRQSGEQPACPPVAGLRTGLDQGAVSELAAGAGLFTIVMEVQVAFGQDCV